MRSKVLNFVVMHAKIVDHILMGKRKNSSKGPTRRVMMKTKPNIKVHVDESPFAAIEVVNPTINKVIANESPSIAIEVDNPTTNRVCADESPSIATKVVNPTTNKVLENESPSTTAEVVNPTTNKVLTNESPYVAIKVVNPTINKVLVDESPSITTKVVNPTIDSESNGGGQTNLQGRPTMPRVESTRPLVHDHIAQREELRKEKNRKHKQRARLATANDKTKGLLLSTSTSNGSSECNRTFFAQVARQSIAILARNYALQLVQDLHGYELEL